MKLVVVLAADGVFRKSVGFFSEEKVIFKGKLCWWIGKAEVVIGNYIFLGEEKYFYRRERCIGRKKVGGFDLREREKAINIFGFDICVVD